jgi:hypothetical protein
MLRFAPDWTMSSATSIETPEHDAGLRPWQFFLLAGMLAATAVVIVATGQSPASIIVLSLTVVATSLVALGAYRALSPLAQAESAETPAVVGGRIRAALEREKTLVLRSLKELEFDYAMKKITKSDYDEMSERLRARAIGLMRQIDAGGYKSVIERELEGRLGSVKTRATEPLPAASGVGRDFSPADHEGGPAEGVHAATATTCVSCGVNNDSDARFCKNCGSRLSE